MFKGAAFRKFLSPQPRQAERVITDFSTSVKKKPANKDDDNIDALCVNCQEMININIIDEHSQVCDKVTEKSVQMDEKLNDERIDFKLARLKKALESQTELQYIKPAEKNLRLQLVDCIEKILRFNQKSDLKQIRILKELLGGIQELSNNFQGYPSLVLYLERVKVLGQEKYRDLIKTNQETVCNWKDQFSGQKNIMSQTLSKKVTKIYNNENVSHLKPGPKALPNPSFEYGNSQPRVWNISNYPAFTSRDLDISNGNAKLQKNQSSGSIGLPLKTEAYFTTTKNNENFAINQSPTRLGKNEPAQSNKINPASSSTKEYINFHPFFKQNENNELRGSLPLNILSKLRPAMENSNSSNKLVDEELRMSLPAQSSLIKNNSLVCMSPLGNRDRNVSRENPIFSRSEQKPPTRYNSPEKDRQRDSLMSSSYLSNMISGELCSPSQRYRNCDNSEQRSASRDSIKLDLEQKLEMKKKELAKVTSLVKKYKHRTATIQISLNDSSLSQKDELQSRGRTSVKMGQPSNATRPSYRGGESESLGKIASQSWLYKNPTQDNESFEEKASINSFRLNDEMSLDEHNQNAFLEEADTETNTEQRMFYSKCLAIKMKFKSNPTSQHIPVGLIYKDAVKNNIPQFHWEKFIENAFMNPERYIDINKVQKKRRQGQGLQNRLIEIAQNKTSLNKNHSLTQLHVFSSEM